ncbi:PAS domain-containing sensor histidine kinase [Chthonobacter albigriseus]|uniref:PAS domain-containing sensor histidine kinase n=1 Tax=Chthonobacter albigriseus TaxID=1683161 RepID=UPI0015EEB58C|nr:PAS domain-containing sensor histidine kinase [Chthonobacter albigriseus]
MRSLINGYDWARTSLGPQQEWPSEVRTAVEIALASPVPIVLLFGADGVMIYNDAYSGFAGGRHPRLLGSAVLEGWPEVADFNANVLRACFHEGGTLSYRDQPLVLFRNGVAENVTLNLDYSPIPGADGRPLGVFCIVVETTERFRAETALKLANERVELALNAGAIIGTWVWDVKADRFTADERFARSFDLDPDQCREGLPLADVTQSIHPDDMPDVNEKIGSALANSGPYRAEYRVRQSDGSWRWVEANGFCEHMDGRASRFPGVLIDINERRQTEEDRSRLLGQLAHERARFQAIVENMPAGALFAELPSGRIVFGNQRIETILRHPVIYSPSIETYHDWVGWHANGERVKGHEWPLSTALQGQSTTLEAHYQRGDGTRAWIRVYGAPVRDRDGTVIGGCVVVIDIDDERRAKEERELLTAELQHRIKNMLSLVAVITSQTFRTTSSKDEARAMLEARIHALSRAYDILTETNWASAEIGFVVDAALEPHRGGEGRFRTEGPDVRLSAKQALSLALAVHELATNAAKYGSLSNDAGVVDIRWSIETAGLVPMLDFVWAESGGPSVSPPKRQGFGSRLIERTLSADFGGTVEMRYRPEGLVCVVRATVGDAG